MYGGIHLGEEVLDGGLPPLTSVMNLQKRVRKFDRKEVGATDERSIHHSEDEALCYPPGLSTTLKPVTPAPERRRSEGDVHLVVEKPGGSNCQPASRLGREPIKANSAPPELAKATIKPTGVPLATDQVSGEIQAATGNELITHRPEEIEERNDPERVWAKVNKYTTHALRGYGAFDVSFGGGLFGAELQKSLKRQANALKHRLWELKIRIPFTNRLISGIALVSWGAEDGRTGHKDAILLNGCFPLDSQAFDKFKLVDDKLEAHGRAPATMYMVMKMARQQARLFAAVYCDEHLSERIAAIERHSDIHEDFPEFSTSAFIAETWERMTFQYNMCVAEGIRYILSQYDDGVTFGKIKRFALTPNSNGSTAWTFTPVFDFDSSDGFWQMAILPEIQQERQRHDIQSLVDARAKGISRPPGWRKKKVEEERSG